MSLQVLISNTDYTKLQNSGAKYELVLKPNSKNVVVKIESLQVLNKALKSVKLETKATKLKALKLELENLTNDQELINLCLNNFKTNGTSYKRVIQALYEQNDNELYRAVKVMQHAQKRHNGTNYDQTIKTYGKELARELMM